ncbi:MAG: hypothetical protein AB2818_14220 [Candidatus Thiodiazotropha sp.]
MIDFRKASLLEDFLRLPYSFIMPDVLFEDEWLCISDSEKISLRKCGLEIRELPGASVTRAQRYFNEHNPLKLNDCFALALAEDIEGSILLTGDGPLRDISRGNGVEVRGVLWITDELEKHDIVPLPQLHDALQLFHDDDLVFLPKNEIMRRLRRLAKFL